ncbi:checkpoint protein HUS1 [Histomonas meleagridis]|uniref:checkpoint protein HUS1 n=1 Tax=Histomonas meleagridis TaxID=135588 RepID=UPI00355A67BB|nr:checkpoint protein HUS1 [Histomonas meleagridis]KAH0804404.1 checkpoint protein HUS1 [Histomonas meleagridis]
MRLTAEITTDLLAKLISILSSCGSDVVLHFSEESLSLCIPHDTGQIGVWVGCDIISCFNKYEVRSNVSNTVSMKLNPAQLAQALISNTSPSIQLHLSRTNDFVYLQLTHKSLDTLRKLEHRVPIILLMPSVIQQYAEPEWELASMCSKFPPLRAVVNWCSNAKSIHHHISISLKHSNTTGNIDAVFRVENEMVCVSTTFYDLKPEQDDETETNSKNSDCEVYVDLKKFIKILRVVNLQPTIGLIYIVDKKYIRLHFEVPAGAASAVSMTYFLNASSQ